MVQGRIDVVLTCFIDLPGDGESELFPRSKTRDEEALDFPPFTRLSFEEGVGDVICWKFSKVLYGGGDGELLFHHHLRSGEFKCCHCEVKIVTPEGCDFRVTNHHIHPAHVLGGRVVALGKVESVHIAWKEDVRMGDGVEIGFIDVALHAGNPLIDDVCDEALAVTGRIIETSATG